MSNALMTLSAFRTKYPEFETAPDPLVTVFLNDAAEKLDASVWGTYLESAHGLLTADLLATSPNGQFARLDPNTADTTYSVKFDELRSAVTSCLRVF